jgi:hypothetical protein
LYVLNVESFFEKTQLFCFKNSVAPATGNHFDLQPGGKVGLACPMPPVPAGLTADLHDSRPAWKRFCLRSLVPLWLFVMILWPS